MIASEPGAATRSQDPHCPFLATSVATCSAAICEGGHGGATPWRCRLAFELAAEPVAGILVDIVHANLKMKMGTRRPASHSFERNCRTSWHDLAATQTRRVAGGVPVIGRVAIAMNHDHEVSVADAAWV